MERIRGAFSAVVLSEDTLLAFRDPDGIRPLVLGDLDGSPVVASETPALDIILPLGISFFTFTQIGCLLHHGDGETAPAEWPIR